MLGAVPHPRRSVVPLVLAIWILIAAGCRGTQVEYVGLSASVLPVLDAEATLYLLGDAGEANAARNDVLAHLDDDIERIASLRPDDPIVVAYLGDNIYDVGAREPYRAEDFAHLEAQASVVGEVPDARVIFVPGNHDWSRGAAYEQARIAIELQQEWVSEIADTHDVAFLPADGCPGPTAVDLGATTRLVAIDTEWLIRNPDDDACGGVDAFYARLQAELEASRDRRVVLLAHHPMASGGPHGGNVGLFEKGPLVYFLSVKAGYGDQHLTSGPYERMLERLRATFLASGAPPFMLAAGHDHTLQVIRLSGPDLPRYQLVSGSASRTEEARRIEGTRYASNGYGYIRLELQDAGARLTVFARTVQSGPVRAVFACTLTTDDASGMCDAAPLARR